MPAQRKHAIVIGGGMAGLLAARVLLNHYEGVTLIERDRYPAIPTFRPGTPQGRHVHVLLLGGQQAIEKLFPGFTAKLCAHGAVERDIINDTIFCYGARSPRRPSHLRGYTCTRQLIEWQVLQELRKFPRLTLLEGHEVRELLYEDGVVRGVRLHQRNHQPPAQKQLEERGADLVVDASGRYSRTPQWLDKLGYSPPRETAINAYLGYVTRFYAPPPNFQETWKLVAIQAVGSQQRGGAILCVEGDKEHPERWMVVLVGMGKDYPPTDEASFLEFARSLADPSLYEAIKQAKPLSPIYAYRQHENYLRHFEQLRHFPTGLLVLGDAVCTFNPIYGQGMTVAALEALLLDRFLSTTRGTPAEKLPLLFQKKLARLIDFPWQMASAADYRVIKGASARGLQRLTHLYFERLIPLIAVDHSISVTFQEVLNMVRPPTALFHPAIMARVLTYRHENGA
ncbi:2-polyprenyl-6-methoxyphenol hydroxylase-like FAD-dependent oxidoreductase [Thermosporothrix hazakensis]|jgi:2-polyprenyl-6-methoxyphenol hydroxylase-like FAD-dependent oxidoreductase|uniref:2-polyprenyl-6-methoxyphenol hydroxylase-like FAD-dependent oxidoreductase n=2 Tax=Thermosporothrix TaxID=768650 RepID=A0A326UB10_THEHA|nr:FAD-binding protein [Thermosporothrix hazakensis]PZW34401.1 2-polyprenyl-6-methoxyphenol hydroxylase-like FAD-dependent oxidoreductase [Thermosporothrix hazakensis]BBH85524.1 hypothetical protein KTC_02750 [Thermosporothrix sp. COM3]GCE46049.1 hypothetical protein KTH_09180 [Thermosporothrix hazakensis]